MAAAGRPSGPEPAIEEEPVSHSASASAIVFPDGLVGLPNLVRHRLTTVPDTDFFEITSDDDPTIGFIATTADSVRPGTTDLLRKRGLVNEGEWVLAILAVHGGPLVLDMDKATARQLVLEDPEFPLQAPVAEQS